MNEKKSGKRVRLVQRPWVIVGIIGAVVLLLVGVIALPHFLAQQRKIPAGVRMVPARLEPYHVDMNLYPVPSPVWPRWDEANYGENWKSLWIPAPKPEKRK